MGLSISETIYQSDRFPIYYKVGKELIEKGHAYVCRCDTQAFKDLKMSKTACPCRSQTHEEGLDLFEKMLDGVFAEGEAGVRLKTDLSHPDPAMRDYPIFRSYNDPSHSC
jgi:glutamyl-tRNA synthetase